MDKKITNQKIPVVSIVMPVYNAAEYLAKAIESILSQTFEDFEFIIVNDGSKDNSLAIIQKYANQDSRIKVISRPNKGLVKTLNEGLAQCRGKFIARMDGDDISLPTRLQTEVDFLEAHPDVGLVGTNYIIIDPKDKKLDTTDVFTHPDDVKIAMVTCNQYGHGSVMIRSEVLKKIGVYDPKIYVEDYDLFNRIAHEYKIANIKEPLYKWRRSPESYTFADRKRSTDMSARVRDREFKYLLKHRQAYRIYGSFHAPPGELRNYRRRKSLIFSNLAYLYARDGKRVHAILLQLLAMFLTPRWSRNRRHLLYLLWPRDKLPSWQYDGI